MSTSKQSYPPVPNPRPKYGMGMEVKILPGEGCIRTVIGMRYEYGNSEWEYQLGDWQGNRCDAWSWESETSISRMLDRFGKLAMSAEDILINEG